jgi:hypothetical protein
MRDLQCGSYLSSHCEVGVGFLEVDGLGVLSRASRAARWSEGSSIQASPVWVEKNTSGRTVTKTFQRFFRRQKHWMLKVAEKGLAQGSNQQNAYARLLAS